MYRTEVQVDPGLYGFSRNGKQQINDQVSKCQKEISKSTSIAFKYRRT